MSGLERLPAHNEQSTLETALALARWGLPVFPLRPRSKTPATGRGFKDASRNPAVIRTWWRNNPRYAVAVATGHGLAVLDVDTLDGHGTDGPASLARLEDEHGELPRTVEAITPSGGRHLWFLAPPSTKTRPGFADGLDLKASGGYVVTAPTSLDGRGRYAWDAGAHPTEVPLAPIPGWLVELESPNGDRPAVNREPRGEAYRRVTEALQGRRSGRKGDKWSCPAHNDPNPSLSVHEAADGKVLLKCFAGCTAEAVVDALGLKMADLFTDAAATSYIPRSKGETVTASPAAESVEPVRLEATEEATEAEDSDVRPHPIDVNALSSRRASPESFVIDDLLTRGGVIEIAGEEGEGKTMLAEQIVRQTVRAEAVAGFFGVPDGVVRRAVFLDTEMEETDGEARSKDFDARGLQVPDGTMFWLSYSDINLSDSAEDQGYLLEQVGTLQAQLLWIDTGGNAVSDPKDDVAVRAFFNYLSRL